MKTKLILLLIITVLFSCHKEKLPFENRTINDLTSNLEGEIRYRTQLRLSFAKAVASAMESVRFREYLNRISRENTDSFFNEIVFAIHKDDKITNTKSFEDILRDAVDKEVFDLFGKDFIDKVLKDDPLVTIKIPDIFYNLEWEIDEYAPLVLAKTPLAFSDTDNFNAYYSYHFSGYQKMLSFFTAPEYFSIVVKYSEDYILYDKSTNRNEKGIHIFDIVHQVQNKWSIMGLELNKTGVPYFINNNMVFIKKREIFNTFKEKCEPKSFEFADLTNCNEACKRDCIEKEKLNNILEKIKLNHLVIDSDTKGSVLFEDNYQLLSLISSHEDYGLKSIDKYDITGFRKVEFAYRNFNIKHKKVIDNYEDIGEVDLLEIEGLDYNNSDYSSNYIELNHLIEKGWKGSNIYDLYLIKYKQDDIVGVYKTIGESELPILMYASSIYSLGRGPISYCSNPGANYNFGILEYIVKY